MKQIVKLLTLMCRKAHLPAILLIALLSGLSAHADVVIDETTFPDANFRNYILSQTYGTDGVLTDAEIAEVTQINCTRKNIASLEGIGYFTALQILDCSNNQLTALDVSNNMALYFIDVKCNQLSTLDIRNNAALTSLYCDENQLTELDIHNNTELATLSCAFNKLSELNVNPHTELMYFYCHENQLTTLDITQNTALIELICYNNQITALDVSRNTALTDLRCYNNQLTELDVRNNTALIALHCSGNPLTALDVTKNTALTVLDCGFHQLTNLDVSKNTMLTDLNCCFSQLSALDVSNNTDLRVLVCQGNPITVLDVTKNTALTNLVCTENQLTELDVTNNTALLYLQCWGNQLTALDVSKNAALIELGCSYNQLTAIYVSKNIALTTLNCSANQLTELDLTYNSTLTSLLYQYSSRNLTAESGITADGEHFYYLRLDNNTDGDKPIVERMTETNFGSVESKFDPSRVLEWTSGGSVIEGQKRVITNANDADPQNIRGKILLLTDVTEDPITNTAFGYVSYKYDVNNSVDPDGNQGDFALNWTAPIPTNPITAVTDLRDSREAVGVTYTNLAGQVSDKPFTGVNIVVTRYDDGSTRTDKVIR